MFHLGRACTYKYYQCELELDRDHNAAKNILAKGLACLQGIKDGTPMTLGNRSQKPKRIGRDRSLDCNSPSKLIEL